MIVRNLMNSLRNLVLFRVCYPWVIIGRNVRCQWSARFWAPHRHIILGNNVGIGHHCVFIADAEIGDKVLIAGDVAFLSSDEHIYDVVGKAIWDSGNGHKHKIVVEDDVWIGHGAVILAPARVGRGSVVAAGSVVTSDVPRYSIVGGVPARLLKMRFTPQQISTHERILVEAGEMKPEDRSTTLQ